MDATKKDKKLISTFRSHIKNLLEGVKNTYVYELKICSSHFPMDIGIDKDLVIIKNFLGEKTPRKAKILPNVNAKVEGDKIIVESVDRESAGQTAANIESATKRTGFDRRVFQDGIYITKKVGKEIR